MLQNWTTVTSKGNPVFVNDGELLTIICEEGDRGIWRAEPPISPDTTYIFSGAWINGKVRLIWLAQNENELGSLILESDSIPLELIPPDNTTFARVNCVRSGSGTAVFESIDLVAEEEQEFLPVPPPDTAQKHNVTGWKWGRNIALMVHDDLNPTQVVPELPAADTPPTYIDEDEDIIPYEVKGWQHGRRLDLEIGNMRFSDEEE